MGSDVSQLSQPAGLKDRISYFFVVLARDRTYLHKKLKELDELRIPYVVICGERVDHPRVVYRPPKGKYDAINFSLELVPEDVDVVVFNDVDTEILGFEEMLNHFRDPRVGLVYSPELVERGPQALFFRLFNPLRKRVPLAASGELMMVRRELLERVLPMRPCKAEDTYIMFKALELGYKVVFHERYCVRTERPTDPRDEEIYKRRTVTGIYQALSMSRPPAPVRLAYYLLPFLSVFFLLVGRTGYYWARGVIHGLVDYLLGDRGGSW